MVTKSSTALALIFALLPAASQAQPASQLLEKGIYTQMTAGDLDGAIKIYRQIVASNPPQREYAAQAQYLLLQALLQKGDSNAAAAEAAVLARDFPDYKELAAKARADTTTIELRIEGPLTSPLPVTVKYAPRLGPNGPFARGVFFKTGRYHHHATGVEVTLPEGWAFQGDTQSTGYGDMVILVDSVSKFGGNIWIRKENGAPLDIPGFLKWSTVQKIDDRRAFDGYRMRPESFQYRTVGGKQALTAIAEYTQNGEKFVEYFTWVRTENTTVLFNGRNLHESDLPTFLSRFEPIVDSAVIP
jgi:hypothetical protein